MDRAQKSELAAGLNRTLATAALVVVTRSDGMTVAQSTALRVRMRDVGAAYKVTKNRITRIASEGTPHAAVADLLRGPTALATSADLSAARVAVEFGVEILGGSLDGKPLDVSAVKALAALPSLDQLRARIIGLLVEPGARIARLLNMKGTEND